MRLFGRGSEKKRRLSFYALFYQIIVFGFRIQGSSSSHLRGSF